MATYCFKCRDCGAALTGTDRALNDGAVHCTTPIVRDYRAEAVGIGAGVRVSRTGTQADQARGILPDNGDFAGPGDPDGTKGMKAWHEQFEPKGSRPAQTPGRIERTVF